MIDAGADLNVKGRRGNYAPIYSAARSGNKEILSLLLKAGADVSSPDIMSLLADAVSSVLLNREIIALLVEGRC